jgi:hypothetical protein
MPRIRCHYVDCILIDDGYCGAAAIEIDPDLGCMTYSLPDDQDIEDEWDDEEELEEWDEIDAEDDDDLWVDDDDEF